MTRLNARSRGFDGDLSEGSWRGVSCAFCGTVYKRPQPNSLRESTQSESDTCDYCGSSEIDVRWGALEARDGGVFFKPYPLPSGNDVTVNHKLTPEEAERLK